MDTEDTIAKYAVDANLFRLGSTNPKKNSSPWFFLAFIPGFIVGGHHGSFSSAVIFMIVCRTGTFY